MSKNSYLIDEEEQDWQSVLDDFEEGKIQPLSLTEQEHLSSVDAAKKTLQEIKERQSINIRLPKDLLFSVKRAAQKKGMPYQTLIISTLHQEFLGEKNAT